MVEDAADLLAETFAIRDRFSEGPFAARLKLADLRGARIGPMTEEEVAALIARVEAEIGEGWVRERVADRLRERLSKPGKPSSGPVLPPALTSAVPVPVRLDDEGTDGADGTTGLADVLGEPMAPEAYERALGEHLAGLACGEESNRYVALGVARRGFNDAGETVARVLAAALLDDGCKGYTPYLATLSEEEEKRRELERLAAPAGEADDGGG